MTLLVDIGNSRMKWARLESSGYRLLGECAHEGALDPAFWGQFPCDEPFDALVMATVLGEENEALIARGLTLNLDITPRFVHSDANGYGVTNAYPECRSLGVDRWLALIGARSLTQNAVCIVDCGTAVTIDLMDENGVHLGGLIAPGLHLMNEALRKGTAQLRAVPEGEVVEWADNTADAITSGVFWSVSGLIHSAVQRVMKASSSPPCVYLTGGDAAAIQPCLDFETVCIHDLVLKGLAVVAREER
jgi:type III pantothenate kinase